MDDSLSFESFLEGANKAAHKAMDDHARREYDEFALHAGVAVERLAKAVLISKNPIYIAEMRGSAEMLFHLGGHRMASKVRTTGAGEAIARLRTLGVLSQNPELDRLIDLRNGVAHTTGGDEAKSLLPTLILTVQSLIEDVDGSPRRFWGRWNSAVHTVVDEERSQVYRDIQLRVRQAKHRFEDKFAGMPDEAKDRVLATPPPDSGKFWVGDMTVVSGRDVLFISAQVPCPACTGPAMMTLVPGESTSTGTAFVHDGFICHLCDLKLHGREEMTACGELASVPQTVSVPPLSVAHSMRSDVRLGETHKG
ncbi:hypothetical protein [Streptomyces sp. NPDC002722]|uniref:hypothetical protein n=1 Tax=Streptomyces sp. NPDC002722 TaxID=3154425 RepID=UPI00332C9635